MATTRPTVSLCMIVKNEEAYLARCLASARELVDEIIIVDTGSTDGTLEVARQYGAKVATFQWRNDFSAARNYSLAQATCDWIMYLDADEELMDVEREAFLKLLEREEVEGYYFYIVSPTSEEPGSQQLRHTSLRLFRNRTGYRFQGALHEQIIPSILATNPSAKLVHSGISIYHYGYREKMVELKNKTSRNLEILKRQLEEDPDNSFLRYNLGVALYEVGDLQGALEEWQRVWEVLDMSAGYAPTFLRNYAISLLKAHRPLQALQVTEKGLLHFPDYTDLYYLKGQALEKLDRYTQSQDAFLRCLELGEAPPRYVTTEGVGSYLALYNLGKLMEECGYYELAVNYYYKAWAVKHDLPGIVYSLGRALQKALKDPLQVRAYIQEHLKLTNLLQLVQVADLLYSAGDYHGCLIYLNEAILRAGNKPDDVALLKAKCLMRLGRWEEAKYQCLEIGPESPYYPDALLYACICNWSAKPAKNCRQLIEKIKEVDSSLYPVLQALNSKLAGAEEEPAGIDVDAWERLIVKLFQASGPSLARVAAGLLGELPEGEISYYVGKALFKNGLELEAAEYLLKALEEGVSHDDLYYMLGSICAGRRALWEAEQLLHQAVNLNPRRVEYYEKLVEVLLSQTGETLLEALAYFPDNQGLKNIFTRLKECQLQFAAARGAAQ